MFGLPGKTWLQVALATIGGVVILAGIGVCIVAVGGSLDPDEVIKDLEPSATQSATPPPKPTPTPARVWTAEELLECDTTTLTRQNEGRALPNELLSDCEVALSVAMFTFAVHLADGGTFPPEFMEHFGNLDEMSTEIDELDLSFYAGVAVACSRVPVWRDRVEGSLAYLESKPMDELLGWEVQVLRTERFVDEMTETCRNV